MKYVATYIFTKKFDMKKAKGREIREAMALIIRAFVTNILLLFATLIKTALRVSRIIIIKKI